MKRVTRGNYKQDKYYPRIVRAVSTVLDRGPVVKPVEVLIEMNLLREEHYEDWRLGRIPYLERVIQCNLAKASRILRILRRHAHDLNLRPLDADYRKWGKGRKIPLRFSKFRDPGIEDAYARHFVTIQHFPSAEAARKKRLEKRESAQRKTEERRRARATGGD